VEADVADVAEEMMERYVRHVLLERDGELAGIVSARDLLGAYASVESDDDDATDVEANTLVGNHAAG
jgi:CBS domain-containing protein